ncbi:hypothetical protein OVS_00565 [Mycoplasma ovis str. Michigan]|uniref:DUF31 domain-containing protein n=1 Tax=Mycoplasma ovis str. Michigan TaxID=1415773 RepID=A0ABN4BQY2_9MOLU|nr:hypothetical protein [Mycoplasma ovis]AHC40104.1 hypothetical protein OVS_00565 [Mycoplasma ovis str. Michigan]
MNWKWKVDGLYPRNPEAFKPDGGAIWTTGEKGNIFEDQYFYVPKDFNWLGENFKNVKSLVSGIGLKITNIEGEKFSKDMKSISFKNKRDRNDKKNGVLGKNIYTRKVGLERVAYYKPENSEKTWELGKGVCIAHEKIGDQNVYLFIGFAEVKQGERVGERKGHKWNFNESTTFKDGIDCGYLRNVFGKEGQLIVSEDGDYQVNLNGQDNKWEANKVILFGHEEGNEKKIWNLQPAGKFEKPVVGILMGVAINLGLSEECNKAWSEEENGIKSAGGGVKLNEWRGTGWQAEKSKAYETWEAVMNMRKACINKTRDELEKNMKEEFLKGKDQNWNFLKGGGRINWRRNNDITSSDQFRRSGNRWIKWTDSTELPYKYA